MTPEVYHTAFGEAALAFSSTDTVYPSLGIGAALVIRRILTHLGLPTEGPDAGLPRPPPGRAGDLFATLLA